MTDTVIHDRNPRWMREMDNRKPRAISMGGHKKPGSTIKDRPPPGPAEVVGDIYELMNKKFHVLEAHVQEVVDVVHDSNTVTNKRLTELDKSTELLTEQVKLLLEHNTEILRREQEKQTVKNGRSRWKKLYTRRHDGIHGSSSELAHKYIVD